MSASARHLAAARAALLPLGAGEIEGDIVGMDAMGLRIAGLARLAPAGAQVTLIGEAGDAAPAEIIGNDGALATAIPYAALAEGAPPRRARLAWPHRPARPRPDATWIGRAMDALGAPIDGRGPLIPGPPQAASAGSAPRRPLGAAMDLGVRALDIFTPLRAGQKIGIFAGAGTGKSSLLSMIARNNAADLTVLILLGEREIEIAHYVAALEENPRRIVVAESSGRPATARRLCLRTGLDIATHFAAEGMAVLVVIDSITRYFHALRDIALYQGELPAARGIPVSVFAEAARELERIGPARLDQPRGGAVTALIAVLTEGNNINDPISDFMRGVLDGHILLDRAIAEAGRYPAVDILKSISRSGLDGLGADQRRSVASARTLLLDFYEARELEKFGVAPDPKLIQAGRALESFLAQDMQSAPPAAASFAALAALLADPAAGA